MAFVDHCRTADDVRRNAREVYERARARDQRLRAAAKARAIIDNPPEPQPVPQQPEEIRPPPEPKPQLHPKPLDLRAIVMANLERINAILNDVTAERDAVEEARPIATISTIQKAVTAIFRVTRAELCGQGRTRDIVIPRHVSFLLCRMLTRNGLPQIGRCHGGRDHTTALNGVRKLDWLRVILMAELSPSDPLDVWAARAAYYLHVREIEKKQNETPEQA